MAGSEKPRVAVIGCGYWGKNLVRNFRSLGALELVCDALPAGQELAHQIAPEATITGRVDDTLSAAIDALVIATPAETHFELAWQALQAGKDILVEKPLALSYEQGAALVQLANERGRILMVGHVLEYHPAIVHLLDLIQSGELGQVYYIYSNRVSLGKVRREENILWSFAPHDIAVILRIIGALPFQVIACGGSYLQPNIADVTVTNLLFDNGVRAHIHVSWLHPFKEQRLIVVGSKKMASFDDVAKRLVLYDQTFEIRQGEPIPVQGNGAEVNYATDEPLGLECQAFLRAISTRQAPFTDGYSGLQVLKVLQAAQRSLVMNGEPVQLAVDAFRDNGVRQPV